MKVKDNPIPKNTRFKTFQVLGTTLTVIGLLILALYLALFIYSFHPDGAVKVSLNEPTVVMAWSISFIVVGQLMHWLVAMLEGQNQIIQLLKELRDK
jgi:hypothetical protein